MTDDTFDRKFLAGFAVFCLVVVMAYLACVTFIPISQTGVKYADMAVPLLLGSVIGAVVGFFFGSSKSQTKSIAVPASVQVSKE